MNEPFATAARQIELQLSGIAISEALATRIRAAIAAACQHRGVQAATFSVRVVTDAEIHEINREYLQHDYPTDVISFGYELTDEEVEGELVVSRETAERVAARVDWPADHELLLYIIHGALHCLGMEDGTGEERAAMRASERQVLQQLQIDPPPRGPDEEGGETC